MKSIQRIASITFIISIAILSGISILGVWDFFNTDVIWKSFETLGILSVVAIVVVAASSFIDKSTDQNDTSVIQKPVFTAIRNITLGVLILSAVLLAFLGILSVWDVITDHTIVSRSFSSLAILTFSSMIIVMTSLEREGNRLWKHQKTKIIWISVFISLLLLWVLSLVSMPGSY